MCEGLTFKSRQWLSDMHTDREKYSFVINCQDLCDDFYNNYYYIQYVALMESTRVMIDDTYSISSSWQQKTRAKQQQNNLDGSVLYLNRGF